uniref:Glutamyl aminopeptidase n=1 Tax=Lygus hesperus TaxID=30085 RepID=A0A0A9ZCF5_LYGHE
MSKRESQSDIRRATEERKTGSSEQQRRVSVDPSFTGAQKSEEHAIDAATNEKGSTENHKVITATSSHSLNPTNRSARTTSKPTNETPGWAHPSQKLPNPYLDMPPRKEKRDRENLEASSRIEKAPPTTDKQQTVKQGDSNNSVEKLKVPSDKPSDVVREVSSLRITTNSNEEKYKQPKIEPVESDGGKKQVEREIKKSKPILKEESALTQEGSTASMFGAEGSKAKVQIQERSLEIVDQSDPVLKRKYFADKKRQRPGRKPSSRKPDKVPDKSEGGGDGDRDLTVAHPDFLDESYLEAVDNEPRRESRISDEYYGGMKPLRFSAHKKKNASAFKERVHQNRKGRSAVPGVYDWEIKKRLPDDVVPFQYTVYLEPHIESNVFFGRVSIALDLVLPKSQLWLHVRNLHITSTQLFDQNENQIPILGAHKFRKHEFFVIFLEANLRPGIYMINIDYNGILSERNQVGIFSRNYKNRDGSKRNLVYTQLGPLYARRVFPCFDEPIFKATYEISVVRPTNDFIAISNMTAENEEEDSPQRGSTTVFYYVTAPMSTYHLAVVICDFHHIPINDQRLNVPFTVYVQDEKVENYQMAINIVLSTIDWFQEYTRVKFPLPKLDLIIMPELNLPSIEGYSVIMIQEDLLKAKEEYEYETLHYTLAREVISQWIGGSVTVTWWNDLWYKEGLTTMLANYFLDHKYPEQQAIPNFICYSQQPSMFYDSFLTARKIDRVVEPNDISDCMDPVTFTKAAAVFRMLEQMSPTAFQEGLHTFLGAYHLQNATWKNLSDCFSNEYDKNAQMLLSVDSMLFSWSQYPGYPLIASAIGMKAIAVNQRRFMTTMDSKMNDINNFPSWEFPVSYVLSIDNTEVRKITMKADSIDADARDSISPGIVWYKVNYRQTGFFRTIYQDDEWNTIKKIMLTKPELFTPEDRANFLDDMFSLSRAGFTCYGQTLSTLTYLRYGKEVHWLPWACILKHLVYLKNALSSNAEDKKNLQNFMSYILNPVLTDEIWSINDKDDPPKRKWKLSVLRLACSMEIPAAKRRLAHLVKVWGFSSKKPKPEALRFIILRFGAPENGYSDQEWLKLWKMFQDEKKSLEKKKLLAVMASVGNDTQLTSILYSIKTDEVSIDDHGFFTVLYEMATTRLGCRRVWDFVRNNWTYLTERFSPTDSRLFLLFPHMAQLFDQDSQSEELMEFVTHEIPTLQTALSYASNNIYWNNRYRRTVSSWLRNVQKTLASTGHTVTLANLKSKQEKIDSRSQPGLLPKRKQMA